MLSIGALGSAAQGASYYERDGYYARDDPDHKAASAWAGRGAGELGLDGPFDPETFRAVLEGNVPDGTDTRLGRRTRDGGIEHRPGRDLTFSAPKSVSVAALVGGDARIVEAHDRAVTATLGWVEGNAAETRLRDPETARMVRAGGQKIVAATFRHDSSRNLDPPEEAGMEIWINLGCRTRDPARAPTLWINLPDHPDQPPAPHWASDPLGFVATLARHGELETVPVMMKANGSEARATLVRRRVIGWTGSRRPWLEIELERPVKAAAALLGRSPGRRVRRRLGSPERARASSSNRAGAPRTGRSRAT